MNAIPLPTHRLAKTTAGDTAGRPVTLADPHAAHQIRLLAVGDPRRIAVGCTCGCPATRLPVDAPDGAEWAAYAALEHRPPLEAAS